MKINRLIFFVVSFSTIVSCFKEKDEKILIVKKEGTIIIAETIPYKRDCFKHIYNDIIKKYSQKTGLSEDRVKKMALVVDLDIDDKKCYMKFRIEKIGP